MLLTCNSEMELDDIKYIVENVIAKGRAYLTFAELGVVVREEMLGERVRVGNVYACYAKLFPTASIVKYLNQAGGWKASEKSRRAELQGFLGPELCTAKELEQVKDGQGWNSNTASTARHTMVVTFVATAVERNLIEPLHERPLAPLPFAKALLLDGDVFVTFFGALFDHIYEKVVVRHT